MADPIRNLINERIGQGRATVRELELFVREELPDLVEAEKDRLVGASLRKKIRTVLRDVTEEPDETVQPSLGLPGLPHPAAIPGVRQEGELSYVSYGAATWADRQSHREEQRRNLEHVTRSLWDEQRKDRYLAPEMESKPDVTTAQAAEKLKRRQNAA